jgi:transcriptional regulator with XRE-family HTH domain
MKEQLRREMGIKMKKIRKALGYTQDQMVSHFNIGRANYSRIEKGEIFPRPSLLNTLKLEFNVSLDWLVSNIGEMFQQTQKETKSSLEFGEYTEEVRDLLFHMEKVPMLKHAVLSFFIEYKVKNKEHVEKILHQGEEEKQRIIK